MVPGDCITGWRALQVFLFGGFRYPRADVEAVLRAAGAKLLKRLPPAEDTLAALKDGSERWLEAEGHTIVLVDRKQGSPVPRPSPSWEGICVEIAWLMDTASNYTVQPLAPYLAELR